VTECLARTIGHGQHEWFIRDLGDDDSDQPDVVFVAGLGSGEYLLPHASLLARSRHVLVPDMPGFGRTTTPQRLRSVQQYADALVELLSAETTAPVDLLGNSFGTQIVLAAAARHPNLVRRIVLVGPTFDAARRSYPRALARWLRIAPVEPPKLALTLAKSYWRCGIRTPALAFRAAMRDRPEERIAEVPHRILLIRGSEDHIAPAYWLDDLARRAPDAEVAEVKGVAHTVDFAAPRAIAALTEEFFSRPD
jgi:pimeloyl-ACP methyl ester carboxylesterase